MKKIISSLKTEEQVIFKKVDNLQKRSPFIIIMIAAVIGAITGFVGSLFQYAVSWITHLRINLSQDFFTESVIHYVVIFLIAALMGAVAYYLVKRISPESSGSGIPEIEGALIDLRPVRWLHVIPVKFLGGLGALGSGMVLGREGPTVQMGANLGKMVAEFLKIKNKNYLHTFLATGAAAGITTAFNAPLAGILFVIEEMREEFDYNLASIKAIFIGVVSACVVYRLMISPAPIFDIGSYSSVPIASLWIYLLFGALLGIVGSCSNQGVLFFKDAFQQFYQKKSYYFTLTGALLAGIFGVLSFVLPEVAGGGFSLIPKVIDGIYPFLPLFFILIARLIATVICFSSGAPGGIFSPTLALGTILGVLFGLALQSAFPQYHIELGACAIIGMAGLFAATIRAPLTGIILVMEMTDNYLLIMPLIITCLAATFVAQSFGEKPLYSAILENIIKHDNIQK